MNNIQLIVIEDDSIIGLDLKRRLNRMGISEVELFRDAVKALEFLETSKTDLILMDIRLPGDMDGIEAATIIKKKFNLPVIFVTGYADEDTLNRARLAEPMGYILKPFKEHEIFATITIAMYKNSMDILLKSEQEMQSEILKHIEDSIISLDEDHIIQFTNPAADAFIGNPGESNGMSIESVSRELQSFCASMKHLSSGESKKWENHLLAIEDTIYIVDITISRIIVSQTSNPRNGYLIVLHDTTQLKTMRAQVAFHETHDRLTGLLNRTGFQEALIEELDKSWGDNIHRSLAYFDIDKFNLLNDILGHLAGDEFLSYFSQKLQLAFPEAPAIARLGDDEFAVILLATSKSKLEDTALEFITTFNAEKFEFQEQEISTKITGGMTHFNKEILTPQVLLSVAIDANNLAKQESSVYFKVLGLNDEIFLKRQGELKWIRVITEALEQDRFVLFFQPIIPLNPEQQLPEKVEILIRLRGDYNELLPPNDFIPAAERYDLMHLIDKWVINHLTENFQESVKSTGFENPSFCINLSGTSTESPDLPDFIIKKITENNIEPAHICLEITETAAISNMKAATNLINKLRQFGCRFALDDFGNGFSNFNYLRYLEVDYLKIDGSFVRDMDTDHINMAMVETIHRLAESVGIRTIAEFVHNEIILTMLKEIGVDYAQGYELGKPRELLG